MRELTFVFILLIGRFAAQAADPAWSVNPNSYSFSMTVTAVLQADCAELTDGNSRLGAFVGAEVRGSALNSVTVGDRQIVFMTVYSNVVAGETITFRIYDAQNDVVVDAVTVLTFQEDASFGSPSSPLLVTENNIPTNLQLDNADVMENNDAGHVIGNLSVEDLDAADTHTYSLVAGEGDADNASFVIVGSELQISVSADYESQLTYSVRIRAEDQGGCGVEQAYTIEVLPFNDPPTDILLSAASVEENTEAGVLIGTFTTEDEDADESFGYALVAGTGDTGNSLFMIDGDQLLAVGPFNFENQNAHTIRVRTTDSGENEFEKEFTISVIDINEAPYDLTLVPAAIDENLAAGEVVGDLAATDEDAGDVITFSLDPANTEQAEFFEVVNNQLVSTVIFNYEVLDAYTVDVIATDMSGATATMTFDVSILDANDPPTDLNVSASSFAEDQPAGTLVGQFSAVDEDTADVFNYSLVSGVPDNASFTISGDQLLSAEPFKYNKQDSYALEVTVTDAQGASFSKSLTITIEKLAASVLPSIDLVTPNGDGINDTWVIQEVEKYSNFTVRIYDSSGLQVYSVNSGYDNTWDGTQGGNRLPTGSYFYVLTSNSGSGKSYSGTISLFN